jgi:hypothetical protein
MGYCSVSDVGYLRQTTFDTTSLPTAVFVQTMIDNVTARINIKLKSNGFTLPITDADQLAVLKMYSTYGVVGDLDVYESRNKDTVNARGIEYKKQFTDFLDNICSYLEISSVSIDSYGQGKVDENGDPDYFDISEIIE